MNKKYIISLSFISLLFFGFIQFTNAACSLQNLKDCNREGLIDIIISLIKSKQPSDEKFLQAVRGGNLEKVQRLIAQGANVNAKSNKNYTALMEAAKNGSTSIVRELIARGADVNALDVDKGTALMEAAYYGNAYYGNVELASELLMAGANKTLKDKRGKTALDYAKYEDMINLLSSNSNKYISLNSLKDGDILYIGESYKLRWDAQGIDNFEVRVGNESVLNTVEKEYDLFIPEYLYPDNVRICIDEATSFYYVNNAMGEPVGLSNPKEKFVLNCREVKIGWPANKEVPYIKITAPSSDATVKNGAKIYWQSKGINNVDIFATCGKFGPPSGCDVFMDLGKDIPANLGEYPINLSYLDLKYYDIIVKSSDLDSEKIPEDNKWYVNLPNDSIKLYVLK